VSQIAFGADQPPGWQDESRNLLVPPGRYTSPEFLLLEHEHLWSRIWLVAAVAADVAKPGDYVAFDFGPESLLITRDAEGEVHAFHNVCQHRGHTLADSGSGNCKRFVCPYHGWEWDSAGALCKIPLAARFPQGFEAQRRQLRPVACEVFAGLVWICLREPTQTLEQFLGPIYRHVAPYKAETFQVNWDWTAEWGCNWKTAIDGFNETYHGPATHPQFGEFLDTTGARFQFGDWHSVFIIEHGVRPGKNDDATIGEPMAGALKRAGIDPRKYTGRHEEARARLQAHRRDEARKHGWDASELLDGQLTDTHHFYVFPNLHIDFHGANALTVQRFRPHARDPDQCLVDVIDLKRAHKGVLKRTPHVHVALGEPQHGIVYIQDIERLTRIQKGLHSSGFKGALLSDMERRIGHMHQSIDQWLGEHVPPALRTKML
jgi:phenylpropionate dioxygenase-like ring-hydroxylating dioxygenase large terminal subunit